MSDNTKKQVTAEEAKEILRTELGLSDEDVEGLLGGLLTELAGDLDLEIVEAAPAEVTPATHEAPEEEIAEEQPTETEEILEATDVEVAPEEVTPATDEAPAEETAEEQPAEAEAEEVTTESPAEEVTEEVTEETAEEQPAKKPEQAATEAEEILEATDVEAAPEEETPATEEEPAEETADEQPAETEAEEVTKETPAEEVTEEVTEETAKEPTHACETCPAFEEPEVAPATEPTAVETAPEATPATEQPAEQPATEQTAEEAPAEEAAPKKETFKLTAPANNDDLMAQMCTKRGRKLIYAPKEVVYEHTFTVIGTDKKNDEGIKIKDIIEAEIKAGEKLGYMQKFDGLTSSEIKEEYENDVVYEYAEQEFKKSGLIYDGKQIKVYLYDWDGKACHHVGYLDVTEAEGAIKYLSDKEKYSFGISTIITGGKGKRVIKDESGKITIEKVKDGAVGLELDLDVIPRKD